MTNPVPEFSTMKRLQRVAPFFLTLALSALVGACGPSSAPSESAEPFTISREDIVRNNPALVVIDDTMIISAEALLLRLEESKLLHDGGLLTYEEIADTLEQIILDSLIGYALDTFDLHADTAGWANYSVSRSSRLKAAVVEELLYPAVEIDSLEVVEFYNSRPDLFTRRGQVDLAHIVLSASGYRGGEDSLYYREMGNDELDSLILFRLNLLKSEIDDSISFADAAKSFSLDELSGARGGLLGWIQEKDLHPEIETILYDSATPLLETIGPVVSRDGVHLFFIYGRQYQGIPKLDSTMFALARGYLVDMALGKGAGALVDSIRRENPTTFNDSALTLSKSEADRELWVAVANGIDTVRYVTFQRALLPFRAKYSGEFELLQYQAVAQSVVDDRLLIYLAIELGYDTMPVVRSAITGYRHNYSRDAINKSRNGRRYQPTTDEVKRYFESNADEFTVERPFKIQQILVQDSLLAEFVRALAESGEDFLTLAEKYYVGEPDIRSAAADLGWIGPNDFTPEVYEPLDTLLVNSITPPIKSKYGYHIVNLVDKRRELSLIEATLPVRNKLIAEHRVIQLKKWSKLLRKNRRLRFNTAALQGVRLSTNEDRLIMRQLRLGVEPGKTIKSL